MTILDYCTHEQQVEIKPWEQGTYLKDTKKFIDRLLRIQNNYRGALDRYSMIEVVAPLCSVI